MELLAPNGNPSNLTPEQYKLVRTPEFKAWFGDWEKSPETASKVVDENGEPLVVFHGTYLSKGYFNEFNNVSYFTDNKITAKKYPTESYLFFDSYDDFLDYYGIDENDIEKLKKWDYYDVDKIKSGNIMAREDEWSQIWKDYDASKLFVYECFLNLRNPQIIKNAKDIDITSLYENDSRIEKAKNNNFDSIIGIYPYKWFSEDKIQYENKIVDDYEKESHYITFSSNQIKLADGTNTTFDSSNPDIRFDEGGSVGFVFENLPDDYKEIYQIRAYKIIDGSKFYFSRLTYSEKNVFIIELENGSEIGRATLNEVDNYLFNIRIIEEYRRKGLASSLYDFIEYVVGKKLKPSPDKISNEAKKLWIKRNPDIRFEIGGEVPDEIPEGAKLLPLTMGKFAIVDAEDFDWLNEYKWRTGVDRSRDGKIVNYYGQRTIYLGGKTPNTKANTKQGSRYQQVVTLGKQIMGIPLKRDLRVDYIDGNKLNNQKSNLRVATVSQINYGATSPRDKKKITSKYIGVSYRFVPEKKIYDKRRNSYYIRNATGYWRVTIQDSMGRRYDKNFPYTDVGEIKAAKWYDSMAKLIHGEFAVLNFPDDKYSKGGITEEDKKETYKRWKDLVNMSASELKRFMDSEEGKIAGLSKKEADKLGIHYGRESAKWILKMKDTPVKEWTPTMWEWAKRQISFNSRMRGNKGKLYDEKGRKTRKHLSLLIWGHNPEKYESGGSILSETLTINEVESILGRKINAWDDSVVMIGNVKYKKMYLLPEYERVII